ncbi:hypothetical protein [Paenibacillus sp. NPDC057967]|uniref:hypothetical protein n=1 Tax=Paenibacillus sp. NPDC057967 TaxID=3346293 RepID=UPI0036DDED1B
MPEAYVIGPEVAAITAVLLGNYPFSYLTNVPIDYMLMVTAVAMIANSGYNYFKSNLNKLQLNG